MKKEKGCNIWPRSVITIFIFFFRHLMIKYLLRSSLPWAVALFGYWTLFFIPSIFFSSSSSSFTSHRRRCGSVRAYANAQTPSTQKRDRMEYLHYHEQLIKEPNISKQAPPFAYVHIEEWLHQRSAPPILCIVTLALSPFLNAMWFKVFRLQKTFFSSYLVVA